MGQLRKLLLPFALIYGLLTFVRNKLFDWGILKTYTIPIKSINVGNLSVGGTGKTPHVAFITSFLSPTFKTTILSRGYGRKTKGYIVLTDHATAEMVGDEPLQYYTRFSPEVNVVVCESRTYGAEKIIQEFNPEVLLLDDAFQHRKVKAGLSILLMDYNNPFYADYMLPAGDLREFSSGKKRAHRLIVTKCPLELTAYDKKNIARKTGFAEKHIYFSKIVYGDVLTFDNQLVDTFDSVLLVTGIANPIPLYNELADRKQVELLSFPDHHAFSVSDIQKIHTKFDALEDPFAVILTTEKDFMRLKSKLSKNELEKYPWCYIPIQIALDREKEFIQEIKDYVDTI